MRIDDLLGDSFRRDDGTGAGEGKRIRLRYGVGGSVGRRRPRDRRRSVGRATHSALLKLEVSSGNAISGAQPRRVWSQAAPSGAGRVAVSIGSGSEVDFVSPGTLACRYDFRDFGGAPGRYVVDAVMASTSHTLTSSTAAFASDDIGAYVAVVTQPGGGTAVTVGAGTITAVASGTSATVSFANGTGGSVSGCFCAIGPDNTTAVADAVTAMTTGVEGGLRYSARRTVPSRCIRESKRSADSPPTEVELFEYGFAGPDAATATPWNWVGRRQPASIATARSS